MKILCLGLFFGTLAFGQAKIVNCHGPIDVFPEINGRPFPVKCGKKVTVLEQGQDWSRIRTEKQEGYIATYFLTKSKKQKPPVDWRPAVEGLKSASKIAEDYNKELEKQQQKQQPPQIPPCITYDQHGRCVAW